MKNHATDLAALVQVTANLYRIPEGATEIEVENWAADGAPITLKFNSIKFPSPRHEAEAAFDKAR